MQSDRPNQSLDPTTARASPVEYKGEWRVDTHPRLSRDERTVCIDSPHTGQGRQLHLIDIGGII